MPECERCESYSIEWVAHFVLWPVAGPKGAAAGFAPVSLRKSPVCLTRCEENDYWEEKSSLRLSDTMRGLMAVAGLQQPPNLCVRGETPRTCVRGQKTLSRSVLVVRRPLVVLGCKGLSFRSE